MLRRLCTFCVASFCLTAICARPSAAQVFSTPAANGNRFGTATSMDLIDSARMDGNLFLINSQAGGARSPLQAPSGSVSQLDLKAPAKAQREYEKGYQLLMKKDAPGAIAHLTKSIEIYPSFVAAHNALGTAYLNQGDSQQAVEQFHRAIALDEHLPNSYLNLGCAQLAMKNYSDAEGSLKKASAIAPMDLSLLTALTYAEFANQDYAAVVSAVKQIHGRKHEGAAVVHSFAAGAMEAQGNFAGARGEMETALAEAPKSESAGEWRKMLQQIKDEEAGRLISAARGDADAGSMRLVDQPAKVDVAFQGPTAAETFQRVQQSMQDKKEEGEILEAEAEPVASGVAVPTKSEGAAVRDRDVRSDSPSAALRVAVDEVAIFFAATDHGSAVTNLTVADVAIRDNNRAPDGIVAFRNEAQLPLRLGLVIDTSNSVTERFHFEQAAAAKFLQSVMNDKDDLAFVVGVNNSVLVVQDFTADQARTERAINELAPGGGTALWDAVGFAAEKLASHPETGAVARMIVVISDGADNSSASSLKEAIAKAQAGEVAVYTISTREATDKDASGAVGGRALKTLSSLTGGTAFAPGSVHGLSNSLSELQQVIRARYLLSYRPAEFRADGGYRGVEIKAEKDGRKLTVYARKGYYASSGQTGSTESQR
ncbi:MAG TPA: VWA domain-containing protein [Candidatus Acidoferrum sp.]|nr:VWA domain-containing protein [Candidatus Acidoferrum sp.]